MIYFGYFSFSLIHLQLFKRSRDSLGNHARSQTIMVKIYTRFLGRLVLGEYPLPPGSRLTAVKRMTCQEEVGRRGGEVKCDRGRLGT